MSREPNQAAPVRRSRLRRFVLRSLALVLAILLAATLAIKTTTGRSGVFAFVASRIESRSGIRISIGSSRLSVLGGRITFEKVTVQAEGRERPFATAGEVDVKFDWSALFRSPVRLDRVVLVGGMADTAMLPQRSGKTEDDGEPPRVPLQIDDLRWGSVELASWSGGEAVAAYMPDCKTVSDEAREAVRGVRCLIIDALRPSGHPTHMSISEAVAFSQEVAPGETWLTHIAHEVSHAKVESELPQGIRIAYDGLRLKL